MGSGMSPATQRFRIVAGALLAAHFLMLWAELQRLGAALAPAVAQQLGRGFVGGWLPPAAGEAAVIVAVTAAAVLAGCVAVGYAAPAAAGLLFLISVWVKRALPFAGVDDLFVCFAAFWLFWFCASAACENGGSRRRSTQTAQAATNAQPQRPDRAGCAGGTSPGSLTVLSLQVCVWLCYLAPGMWSGDGVAGGGWLRLLALAPLLYVLKHPAAVWTATGLQLGVHGWLAFTQSAPITQCLLVATALLFHSDAQRTSNAGRHRVDTGEVVTVSVALLCLSLLLLPLLRLPNQMRRVERTLAGIGLHLTAPRFAHRFEVVTEHPDSSSPLIGTWTHRRWRSRLEDAIAAFDTGNLAQAATGAERVIAPIVAAICGAQAHASGPARIVATNGRTQQSQTLARFYCDDRKVASLRAAPPEGGSTVHDPYAL